VAHAFLNGLVRGFWRMACRDAKKNSKLSQGQEAIISKASQEKIAANVRRMCPTSEFDSAFKNIIEYAFLPTLMLACPATRHPWISQPHSVMTCIRQGLIHATVCRAKQQTMDDKLVWTDTVSAFALHDVEMPEALERMWGHLRSSVLYFLRYRQGQHTQEHINRAQDELLQYGRLAQETWNMEELLTNNLHTCMLHVPEQVRLCGAAAFSAEWWLERLMQVFKRVTKYRCTRYPETSAVQHWLTVAALDEMRLHHPRATGLLNEIRRGRRSTSQDSTLGQSWLSGTVKPADSKATTAIETALRSVEQNHGDDGMRVTLTLEVSKVCLMKRLVVGPRGRGVPVVELFTASTASIKNGKSLVRTQSSRNAKQDCHALVPYSLEEPSPAAEAAQAATLAALAVSHMASELTEDSCTLSNSGISAATAREAMAMARAGAEDAQRHAAVADASAGYNAAAAGLVDALNQVAAAVAKALSVSEAPVHLVEQRAALQRQMHHCCQVADQLPAKCMQPVDPAPASMCMLLEIEHLMRWEEVDDSNGEKRTYRLAVGNMTQLQAICKPALNFETVFCDGSRGRRKRVPTLLTPQPGARSYKYAVWLDQIESAMVKAEDSKGRCYYVPTNKSSTKG
jgi:hypothetical protein